MKKIILSVATVVILASSGVHAEFAKGSQSVAIFGGAGGSNSNYDFEPGEERSASGGGGAFGAQYLYYLRSAPAIAIGADLASSLNGNGNEDDMITGFDTTARLKSVVGMAVMRLAFPRGTYRPYLFGGVGMHRSSQQLSAQPRPGATWLGGGSENRMLVDDEATSAAIGYGIGMDLYATESFFLGFELRGVWLAGLDTDETDATRAAGLRVENSNDIQQGNIFMRVGWTF